MDKKFQNVDIDERIMMIDELFRSGNTFLLKEIRDGFTRWLPIELIHIDDRVLCEYINNLLN